MLTLILLSACSQDFGVSAPEDLNGIFEDYVSLLGTDKVYLDKKGSIELVFDDTKGECFEISTHKRKIQISGGLLGLQYGLSELLEQSGIRFFHPYSTFIPEDLQFPEDLQLSACPETPDRGLHLHNIHPTEAYFAAWEGDEEQMQHIGDWLVKNKGNYLQWVALDNMPVNWEETTRSINEHLHERGLKTGIGIQLFSGSNLQRAFNLVHEEDEDYQSQMNEEFSRITNLGFDNYNLSFGEFFSSEPEDFINAINLSNEVLKSQQSDSSMTTLLHVGADLTVEYQGEEIIYYLLAQYADQEITPWVHTVMYYNLYDDAGGAYHHEEFDQHRDLIERYLEEGKPVGYLPESAYWCAFDSPIPQFLPVYIKSRAIDIQNLEALPAHILFTTGWEWGYWLNDVSVLKMNFEKPQDYCSSLKEITQPLGLNDELCQIADLQYEAFIENRLAPWTISYDVSMELGFKMGIYGQPPRPEFSELSSEHYSIVSDLENLADSTEIILKSLPSGNQWLSEIAQGIEINVERTRFMALLVQASIEKNPDLITSAEVHYEKAREIVDLRHANLWWPEPEKLLHYDDNDTLYPYGYLYQTDQMCFWQRELTQVKNYLFDTNEIVPGCLF